MVKTSVFIFFAILVNFFQIYSLDNQNFPNGLIRLNTTSGIFQGKETIFHHVPIRHFFGIPYGEKPIRFNKPVLRQYHTKSFIYAIKQPPACPQISGGLSYGPFQLSDMFDEDCLSLNMFIPVTKSSASKAIMVYCHGGSNQVGSASLYDGSAIAALGDVIVITINYRLNIFGFLTPDTDLLSGNYGLHDQLLALKWISINAKNFNGDPTRITYVGHSTGAVNALLLAMSKRSEGLITRVIAQSGCPFHRWAIDQQPKVRFDNVIKQNHLKTKEKLLQTNLDQLKIMPMKDFQYMYNERVDNPPDYPFPVIDNDILTNNLEQLIHTGPLIHTDILMGVTADESLSLAEEHIFHQYLPRKYHIDRSLQSSTVNNTRISSLEDEQSRGLAYLRKNQHIKKYLQRNHPNYLCFYDEIQARYMPRSNQPQNVSEIAHLYTNLVSDLMFYYDFIRFLHERLHSKSSASTYVYYYTNPPKFNRKTIFRDMVGHQAELDFIWGSPFFNRTNTNMNSSYTSEDMELSRQMIQYWTNFAKTGNPNDPNRLAIHWPIYEKSEKSFLNFHVNQIRMENNFLEERFHFWNMLSYRQICAPFRWYHTMLLVGILILTLFLIAVYIFCNTKGSRRNIKPTELTTSNVITTYHFLPNVVS